MLVPACCRICSWVILVISEAMSTSLMRLLEAERLVSVVVIASEVYCRRLWKAPRLAALVETLLIAVSRLVRAAEPCEDRLKIEPVLVQSKPVDIADWMSPKDAVRVSAAL